MSVARNLIASERDISFLLYEWLDAAALCSRPRFTEHSRETFDAVLETAASLATESFAPHNKKSDANEPYIENNVVVQIPEIKAALTKFIELGFIAAGQDEVLGGMQLPKVVENAMMAWFMGANVATAAYVFLTMGNANLLCAHGTPAQIETFAKPLLAGRFFGTMCLSEPQAGSSLGDIQTRAILDNALPYDTALGSSYRLTGNKMWISGGDHTLAENIVHLVLAKIPEADGTLPAGTKGISLFIVPKFMVEANGRVGARNDVVLAGLNHKMGYRGTTNCLLNFGEGKYTPHGAAGAIGFLVGEAGRGLQAMFHMMNEARIGVGLGATMLGYTGYLHSLEYARQRKQGRPVDNKNPSSMPVAIIEHVDVKRMLLAQKAYVEGALALNLYCAKLVDEEKTAANPVASANATLLLDMLTPIAKSWPSQWCLQANYLAIQVHGGYGYTRDYNVEQFYRDNRLNPIHEGTHGVQALDLLGRKVWMQGGAGLTTLVQVWRATSAAANALETPYLQTCSAMLEVAIGDLLATTAALRSANNAAVMLANASLYLEAFGQITLAWIWLEQAICAARTHAINDVEERFYAGKKQACIYFFQHELPQARTQLALLATLDTSALDMQQDWF
jgi:alkylation response protein AidB-like acyl-CoA dehydrogenase